jgi:hypothetical protein
MANLRKWSSSASGNATVTGGVNTINFAEGQTPGSVNNSAREMMAQVRSIYTPSEWGWVEHSATVSVASQTSFKLGGNQTTNWTAGRRWRLKSGSTTRYGSVVSSSFTAETTITVTVDSGSLSASHSLAALAGIDSNHVPASPQFTSIELGNASDTTITRSAAGVLAVEGGVIPKENRANTFTAAQAISMGASQAILTMDANAAVSKTILMTTAASNRWLLSSENTAESGSNAGSNFVINRYSDAGSYLGTPLLINRATGLSTVEGLTVTSSGGLGYGTGSGGAVTQITSKATGVTLNKTNGQITMHNAALAAAASVAFNVTCDKVTSKDTVIACHSNDGGTAGSYVVQVTVAAAGVFGLRVTNVSGGSLSEAVVINFAVIKAVTS